MKLETGQRFEPDLFVVPGDDRAALIDDRLIWHPRGAATAVELDVKEFFAPAADDAPLR